MMHQPPPSGPMVPPPSQQPQYGYQQPSPYGMAPPPPHNQPAAAAAPPQMWNHATVPGQSGQPATADDIRTLWIGDLQYWMDENFLFNCFAHTGEVSSVKVIRNKQTQQIEGYGFIEFVSHAAAERVLQTYNKPLSQASRISCLD